MVKEYGKSARMHRFPAPRVSVQCQHSAPALGVSIGWEDSLGIRDAGGRPVPVPPPWFASPGTGHCTPHPNRCPGTSHAAMGVCVPASSLFVLHIFSLNT
eukprot:1130616-Rhodomonas_salina.2